MSEFSEGGRFPPLNLPDFEGRLRRVAGRMEIFDATRMKYVALTPEEWVRQHFAEYLINSCNVPRSLTGIEISLKVAGRSKRCDILIRNNSGEPRILAECKAPGVSVSRLAFEQVARYNLAFRIPWILLTNGLVHYACKLDANGESYSFCEQIPGWEEMNQ